MTSRKDTWTVLLVSFVILLAISLPYLVAARAGGGERVFSGLLQNPVDGNSYLAKMYQGWQGEWTFTLPYTANPGEGTYLFLFYLLLGHLARITGLSTILVFHLARILSTVFMLLALWRFYRASLPDSDARRLAFCIAGLSSGLGWLAALASGFTADFWVAEAYPFLGAYANPHFPLGLALVLVLVMPPSQETLAERRLTWLWTCLAGLVLGIVLPFGVVVSALVLAGAIVLNRDLSIRLVWVLAGGVPILAYDFWVANTHPVLSGWNAQNLTPAPHLWDTFLSFSPALLLAIGGAWAAWRSKARGTQLLLGWAALGLLLLYLPFGLQRRFILGLYVPLAGLAALGIGHLSAGLPRRGAILSCAFFLLALPTNGMILLSSVHGIATKAAPLYLDVDEKRAMDWLRANTPRDALVLAAPETGLWIPAQTGRRVVAGHPFETVESEARAEEVEAIFRGELETGSVPWIDGVDYIFVGPCERELGGSLPAGDWRAVYGRGGVTIWANGP